MNKCESQDYLFGANKGIQKEVLRKNVNKLDRARQSVQPYDKAGSMLGFSDYNQ